MADDEVASMKNDGESDNVLSMQEANNFTVDIVHIVETIAEVCIGRKMVKEAIKDVALENKDVAIFWAKEKATEYLEKKIRDSKQKKVRALSGKDFAPRLVNSTELIGAVIKKFYAGEIRKTDLINELSNTGIKEVAVDALEALGIPERMGVENMEALFKLASKTMAYTALMEAYRILRKAMEDEQIAHQQRIRMEEECDRAVKVITDCRMEMERVVSDYFSGYYDTFAVGFAEMDKAIIEYDIDGYIMGNAAIQGVLGYHMQFASQNEFDELMMSDEAFKL